MTSKLEQENKMMWDIVSPVHQMKPPRRQTQPTSQGRAEIGTVIHAKMTGMGVEVVSTEKRDIFSGIVWS